MNRRFGNTAIAIVMSAALMFFVASPQARGNDDDRGKCQHAVEQAEAKLDRAIQDHGDHSRQADDRRRDLNAERQRCWDHYHQWWNGREHRWEAEQNWDADDRH